MANYTNESTFVLFKNDKGDNPKRPDYRGKLYIGGEEYQLSAWITEKKDGSGEKYMRGQVQKAQPKTDVGYVAPARAADPLANAEDVPF